MSKTCTRCGERKALTEFFRDKRAKDGRRSDCKGCSYAAHIALWVEVKAGRIVRPERCEECGEAGPIHTHHDDYTKPLDVRWLCHRCHRQLHTQPPEHSSAEPASTETEDG